MGFFKDYRLLPPHIRYFSNKFCYQIFTNAQAFISIWRVFQKYIYMRFSMNSIKLLQVFLFDFDPSFFSLTVYVNKF